jgi:hypothetical protein
MFGWRRKAMLRLVPFSEASPRTFNTLLCDGVTAHDLGSFATLLTLHARLQAERPEVCVLATLDDLGQACYTSGHATDAVELDDVAGHDLSSLGDELFEEGEHPGYLSTPAEFPIRLANLIERARSVDLAQVQGVLSWETAGDANDLITVNRDPETALRLGQERQVLFQFVPVANAADTIAAFPNGYFNSDLDPMQNHVLARRLATEYGLQLFGIGSRFLGFRRSEALGRDMAQRLARDLAALYAGTPQAAIAALSDLLTGREWLLVRYTES